MLFFFSSRRRHTSCALVTGVQTCALPIYPTISLEDDLAEKRELERTMAAIGELPATLKDTLGLRTIEGMSQAETASILGISEKAAETRLYRARARLEKILRG